MSKKYSGSKYKRPICPHCGYAMRQMSHTTNTRSFCCQGCDKWKTISRKGEIEAKKDAIPEGIINIDSSAAKLLGFTTDGFDPHSYLWRNGNIIAISLIVAKKKGEFRKLITRILELGFDFEIPTPSARMIEIGKKQGWYFYEKFSDDFGEDIVIMTNKERINHADERT